MLKSAELGRVLSKQEYDAALGDLRTSLLKVQAELEQAKFPVIVLINGADGAGKAETLNLLNEWFDARYVSTEAYGKPSEAERARPEYWRYWMTLPKAGQIGLFLGSWYTEPILDHVMNGGKARAFEEAITRINAHVRLTGTEPNVATAQEALGELDRQMVAPVKPENILQAVCDYFGLEHKDLMSGRRQRTISLARSVAMFLVRKTAKLSFPEIGSRMGKRNHSTVISACRRIERAVGKNEPLVWTSSVGERTEEAAELIQRLEEHSRTMN